MFMPDAMDASIAGTPSGVAGILIITFGRFRRVQRSAAWAMVACVSVATAGAHSRLT